VRTRSKLFAVLLAGALLPCPSALAQGPKSLDACQVIGRIDGQVILACELLWQVNLMLADNLDKIPPDQLGPIRDQLLKRQLASVVDTKLLYGEFRRTVPAENLPKILENLKEPFEEREVPRLVKVLKVENRRELEQELIQLGSSLEDTRRAFQEKAIAGEWLRSKIKINKEVSHEEMLEHYKQHLADYEYPTQARWEELAVRRSQFKTPGEAFAALANMGNLVRGGSGVANRSNVQPIFAEVAQARSQGFTAKKGGEHDWTTQGALKAVALDRALFSLPAGQMSRIVESETGFHIVRVLERKQAGRTPFTKVQKEISDKLRDERFRKRVETYLTELQNNARIWTIYTGNVSAEVLLGRKPAEEKRR